MEAQVKLRNRLMKALGMRFSSTPAFLHYLPQVNWQVVRAVGDGVHSSVVMAPLQWMMRTFPEAPLVVDRLVDEVWEIDQEHEMSALIERPNPFWSGELLWQATVMSLVTGGNGYWVKVTDQTLRPIQLWWAPSSTIEPRWPVDDEGTTFISHYDYNPGGTITPVRLEVEDVIHFRWGVDPQNIRKGLSPLASVFREIFSDQEANAFSAALLKNMGVPGLIISPDGDAVVGDDDLEASRLELSERFTGDRRGEPMVAGAPTKVSQFGFSPQQMDLRSLRRLPEERVSAVLGVPAIVAGLGAGLDRSTFANMAEAREMAYESGIIPLHRLLASELKNQLLPDFDTDLKKTRCRFNLDVVRVLQEDQNKVVDRKLRELQAGAIMRSEYRRETGRQAEKTDEVFLMPFSVVEVPPGGPETPEPSSSPDPLQAALEEEAKRRGVKATRMQTELMKAFLREEGELTGVFASELVDDFVDLGTECAKAYLGAGFSAADPMDEAIVQRIMDMARVNGFNAAKLKPAMEAHYARVMEKTVSTVNEITQLGVNLPDERARALVREGGTRSGLVDVTRSTRGALFRALAEGRELGESPNAVARRIREHVPAGRFVNAGPQYRAQLIARTETKWAQNISSMEAYKESGVVRGLLAFDAQGGGGDADCISRDGVTFTFGEADAELASEHPNGTLSFAPVI